MSSTQPLESLIRAANVTLIEDGNLDAVEGFFTADYLIHLTDCDMQAGHDGIRKYLRVLLAAFPKVQVKVDVLVGHGNRLAWQRTMSGTQKGLSWASPLTVATSCGAIWSRASFATA